MINKNKNNYLFKLNNKKYQLNSKKEIIKFTKY